MELRELPGTVQERIGKLVREFGIEEGWLLKQYEEIFNHFKDDPQFKTEEDCHSYSSRVLYVRIAAQPPLKEIYAIPWGYTEPRPAKSSGISSNRVYFLAKEKDKVENKVLVCRDERVKLIDQLERFCGYKIKVSESGGVMFAANQTTFEDPKPLPVDPAKFLLKEVGASFVKIAETSTKKSKMKGKYVDDLDIKMIKGIVLRYNKGKRPDGSNWGVYTVSDDSVGKETTTPNGKVIPKQFTVWAPYSQMKYGPESEIIAAGTISGDPEPQMNAVCILPGMFVKPIVEAGD